MIAIIMENYAHNNLGVIKIINTENDYYFYLTLNYCYKSKIN